MIRQGLKKSHPPLCLKDRFLLEKRILYLSNDSFSDIFDQKLQQYVEGDLVNYNFGYFLENNNPKRYQEYQEPFAVLTRRVGSWICGLFSTTRFNFMCIFYRTDVTFDEIVGLSVHL